MIQILELRTSGNESLTSVVGGVLAEVLDEASGEILSLLLPDAGLCVGVARIEDGGIHVGQLGGHLEVEERNLLGGSLEDAAIEDSIDDTAGVGDADALASAVPASVDQISLGTALLHALHELLCILRGMQLQECLAEASAEGGSGLGDAALCAGELSGEAAEEVVLRLLGGEDADGRQYAESVGAEEDDVLSLGTCALAVDLLYNLLDVLDGIADAGVLSHALVGEVDLTVLVHGDVLEEGVALDGAVDVGLVLLAEVDDLSVAAAFEVEHTFVVPSVLVVADEQTLRVGGEGGLTGSGEAEEDSGVLTFHVGISGAVHAGDTLEGEVVVLHGEHTLLHLATVPGVDDNLLAAGGVEGYASLAVEAEFLVVLYLCLGSVVDDEVGLELLEFCLGGLDEHVLDEVCLPSDFEDEAHSEVGSFIGAAESIYDVELLAGELLGGDILDLCPNGFAHGMVIVLVCLSGPPYLVVALSIVNDVLILR